ncbi:hypothetical protein [Spiroplasma culicicola]|uniref:Transmembrane protein n=1 Tax=Spiroplasma culicicola AES-1 TaxID=1276246 RepID=W6A791_9MOLU|nr:hypothetical protein [Spiroplasma culicicola]AHI53013.1 hypothetical protein SCULI_v1c06720 [Spiroplasma culicicola AES-1]
MPIWYYIVSAILFAATLLIFYWLTLKYCEYKDFKITMWIIAPCFTIIGILIIVICLLVIKWALVSAIIISLTWGFLLGIMLGISYYKTRNRIQFNRRGDLL